MAAHANHVKGRGIIVDHTRAGTLEQYVAKDRPPAAGPRLTKTTWECNNCGNFLVSKRGISRCPRCGSHEVVSVTEREAEHQAATRVPESYTDFDPTPDDDV